MSSTGFSIAKNGMSVAINSFTVTDLGNGYKTYSVTYSEKNLTTTVIDQATLRLFFSNGAPEAQYGFFGRVFPGENFGTTNSYNFTVKNELIPTYLEYDANHFFATNPIKDALLWTVNGDQLAVFTINKEPSGVDKTITIFEDEYYTFSVGDFQITDIDNNNLSTLKISSLPALGQLRYNDIVISGSQILAGYEVSVTDIAMGKLKYLPALNGNGNEYSSFNFQVRDNGGTVNDGVDLDQSANTITFNVAAVNDSPVLVNLIADQIIKEDAQFGLNISSNLFIDVDSGDHLTFSAVLVNDAGEIIGNGSLPSWLSFNTITQTFSGIPLQGDIDTYYVKVIATDTQNASVSEQFTLTITNTNDNPNGKVSISGSAKLGQVLTVANNLTDEDGIGIINYQWLRDGRLIAGENNDTHQITQQDVGHGISVKASYTDVFGLQEIVQDNVIFILPDATVYSQPVRNKLLGTAGDDVFDTNTSHSTTYIGGKGNDSYIVNDSLTKVKESVKQGNDTVYSSATYMLGNNIENLVLIGDDNINAKGNSLNNIITGNNQNNIISGLKGNDIITGGGGNDIFIFDTILNAKQNIDTITDFAEGVDKIGLKASLFKKLGSIVEDSEIWLMDSGEAKSKTSFLTYDNSSGLLGYDPDGSGKKPSTPIVLVGIDSHPELQAFDFVIL
jgi:Ca2+-binding RTX toxin-like protein